MCQMLMFIRDQMGVWRLHVNNASWVMFDLV